MQSPLRQSKQLLQSPRFSRRRLGVFAGVFVAGGLALVVFIFAAGVFSAAEPENGILANGAKQVTSAGASGGKAVQLSAPTPAPTPAPTATPTPAPTPTPGACAAGTHVAGSADPWGGCWPGTSNTGVPAGTTLSTYAGPCTINTAGTIINAKTINCSLVIKASNVIIRNSRLNGYIDADGASYSVTIEDSEINAGATTAPALGYSNITARRINVTGAQHSVLCAGGCDIRDSYLHNQYVQGASHNNAILSNGGSNMTFVHNTLYCQPLDNSSGGGCSGDLSLFGDFSPIVGVTIDKNLFVATPGSYCLYGGYQSNKAHGMAASNIDVTNNVFKRGSNSKCAAYGPVTNYDHDDGGIGIPPGGSVWSGNVWDNGGTVNP